MSAPRFLTWRDLPERHARVAGFLRAPFRCYFGNKTPELVMNFEGLTIDFGGPRPFAVGMEGYIRLERLLGDNLCAWPGRVVLLRRGFRRGHNYIEVVPELPPAELPYARRLQE